jgi:spore coat protein U-like protein
MLSGLFKAITMATLSLSLILPNISFAGTTSASTKATATLSSACTISAQNLSFGSLTLPLSSQSASSSMSVLCSKSHAYTVGLAYGGVYGQGPGIVGYIIATNDNGQEYLSNASGTIGNNVMSSCGSPDCNPYAGSTLKSVGTINCNVGGSNCTLYSATITTAYTYGKMLGVAKGDSIGYSIQVPNQPGKIWNTGNASYSDTGTGVSQTIPVVGTLVPSQSGSNYPTPDMYMDTVTATVNF